MKNNPDLFSSIEQYIVKAGLMLLALIGMIKLVLPEMYSLLHTLVSYWHNLG